MMCAGGAFAASYESPSLLPVTDNGPQFQAYPHSSYSTALASSPYRSTLAAHQPEAADEGDAPAGPPMPGEKRDGDSEGSPCGNWCDDCCQESCCGPQWFVSASGLVLTRDNPNRFWTTFETAVNTNQLMNTRDAETNWEGGAEIRVGRLGCKDCSGRSGWEAIYFGIGMEGFASVRDPANGLSTPIDLNTQTGTVDIGARPASDFFDSAREHRIWRNDEIHNIELNFIRQQLVSNNQTQVTWLAGVRYFRFDENVTFASVAGDAAVTVGGAEFGNNGGIDEAYYDVRCENNLVGFQIGARGDYFVNDRLGVYLTPKFGIYGNSIDGRSHLHTGSGDEAFDIRSNKDDVSFLASIDLGMEYQLNDHWRAFVGYRALAVTGVALSDNQFPAFMAATDEMADIDSNGELILHGGFGGVEWRF